MCLDFVRTSLVGVGLAAYLLVTGCMKGDASPSTITGTATWLERMVLPAGTEFEATLEDISRADVPADVIGRTRIVSPGNPPLTFTIPYDEDRIDRRHSYVVRARVTHDGELLFTTDTHNAVLGPDRVTHVELLLRKVALRPPDAPASGPVPTATT